MEVFSSENGLYVKSLRFSTTTFMIQMTNLEHTNDPLPKAVGFIYFYENPFKMMNVSYFIWKAVFFLKIFAIFSRVFENVESWLVYAEMLF